MQTKLSVTFLLIVIFTIFLLASTQADDFKPPTIAGTYKYNISEPKSGEVYNSSQKNITLDYTFDKQYPNEIFILAIYLLTDKNETIKTLVEKANTTEGNHSYTEAFPDQLPNGAYIVRYNETKNTGIYWSTAYYITDIPINKTS
ncbi:7491_t:CDS:2 [Ambispora leptoticha]|uniref:7491_t:CDS:1 n=1 Tax=Ambispora leptoticha TaxID=144679 RepID=A0A9N9A7G1_9GLOM|nr:7491_t:CDS:2 [Ambispora leptoticha]